MSTNEPIYTYTKNLSLPIPAETNNYDVNDYIDAVNKIDNFAGLTPPRALTADKLSSSVNINGVPFDGTKNVINGLWLYSKTETYNKIDIAYKFDNDNKIYVKRSKIDGNIGNDFNDENFWENAPLKDLSDKADVSLENINNNGAALISKYGCPDYENGIDLINSTVYVAQYPQLIYGHASQADTSANTYKIASVDIELVDENNNLLYQFANRDIVQPTNGATNRASTTLFVDTGTRYRINCNLVGGGGNQTKILKCFPLKGIK